MLFMILIHMIREDRLFFFQNSRLRHVEISDRTECQPAILKMPSISADIREGMNGLKIDDGLSLVFVNLERNSRRNE